MIDLKRTNQVDPVKRNVEKGLEETENSPMNPPEAYTEPTVKKNTYEEMNKFLQQLMDEHKVAIEKLEAFEKALVQFKTNGYKLDSVINSTFGDFFKYFDNNLMKHNEKEEKLLFGILNQRLIEAGEHSTSEFPMTAIDVMEDDHIKFIQLGALVFNLLGIATRITDSVSKNFIFDTAFDNSRELLELLKLHIFREDQTLFPLAQKLISEAEFEIMYKQLPKYN